MSGLQSLSRDFAGTRRLFPVELYPGALSYALIEGFMVFLNQIQSLVSLFKPEKTYAQKLQVEKC
jgi:hypothetical protein